MSFTEQEIEAVAKALMETPGWAADAGRPMQAKALAVSALAAVTESRTVTDVAGLDALPDDSAVIDDDGIAYQKEKGIDWSGYGRWWSTGQIRLPAQVLHYGEGAGK